MGYTLSNIIKDAGYEKLSSVSIVHEQEFDRMARITSQTGAERICVFLAEEKYLKKISPQVKMIITSPEIGAKIANYDGGLCLTEEPKAFYFRCLSFLNNLANQQTFPSVRGSGCIISPLAVISENNVVLGDSVIVEDFAVIYSNAVIEDHAIIRAGAKIGIQDYNYYPDGDTLIHLPHAGGVLIEKDVEVGYNTVIGKALYAGDTTKIRRGTKIAFNCCIGHDVELGERNMIYSGAVIGGYTIIGEDVKVTMNATVKNGLVIGSHATVCMGANVIMNVKENTKVFGNPAAKLKM